MSSLQQISKFVEALEEVIGAASGNLDAVHHSHQRQYDSMCQDYIKKIEELNNKIKLLESKTKIFVNGVEIP